MISRPLKTMAGALAALCLASAAHAGQPVELKHELRASGPAITYGDLFVDAGAAAGLAVAAPAPRAGEYTKLNAGLVEAAAKSKGLSWANPDGLAQIVVAGANAPARQQFAALRANAAISANNASPIPDALIHRGDTVTLVLLGPGFLISTTAKALDDGKLGGVVRVAPAQSNKVVEASITGPAAVSAKVAL